MTSGQPRPRVPACAAISTAEALVARLLDEGLDLVEVVEMLGEAFRIAGERAIERRHLGTRTA